VFGWPSKGSNQPDIINFVNDSVVAAIQTLYDEVSEVFPGSYMNIGGDEVNLGYVDGLPEAQAAIKALGLKSSYDLYRRFIVQMQTFATKRGRKLVVWEGFGPIQGQTGRAAKANSTVVIPTDNIIISTSLSTHPPLPRTY
jgi:N-acetyl-beta-hexosaminidase